MRPVEEAGSTAARGRATALLDQLCQPTTLPEAWEAAQTELTGLGEPAVDVLAAAASRDQGMRREMAFTMLALMGPAAEAAAPALLSALHDPSPFIRANAAATLVQFPAHAPAAAPALVELLDSPEASLRQLAATNLSLLESPGSEHVPRLAHTLSHESAPEVLLPVMQVLGKLGAAARPALPQLEQLVQKSPGDVGTAAAQAIQLISAEAPAP